MLLGSGLQAWLSLSWPRVPGWSLNCSEPQLLFWKVGTMTMASKASGVWPVCVVTEHRAGGTGVTWIPASSSF